MKKAIIAVVSATFGMIAGLGAAATLFAGKLDRIKSISDKHESLYLLMNRWVQVKQTGKELNTFFLQNGYRSIAIYGMNYVGETLLRELQGSGISVKYAIDKNADMICSDITVLSPDQDLKEVDAIIVTPITYFDEIEDELSMKVSCPVISLEDILSKIGSVCVEGDMGTSI